MCTSTIKSVLIIKNELSDCSQSEVGGVAADTSPPGSDFTNIYCDDRFASSGIAVVVDYENHGSEGEKKKKAKSCWRKLEPPRMESW